MLVTLPLRRKAIDSGILVFLIQNERILTCGKRKSMPQSAGRAARPERPVAAR